MGFIKKFNTNLIALKYLLSQERDNNIKISISKKIKCLIKGFSSEKYNIYNLSKNDIQDYLSDFQRRKTFRINGNYSIVINDKNLFEMLLSDKSITPKNFGFILNGNIYIENNIVDMEVLLNIIHNHQNLVIKKRAGGGGKGVYKISWSENYILIDDEKYSKEKFSSFISSLENHIIQEYIVQADYSKQIYGGTINSIRILVMRDPESNEPFIATAVHKFGSEKTKPADNVRLGGMTALVDLETGILQKSAYHTNDNKEIIWQNKHPDTGYVIEGTQIPDWHKVKETIILLTKELSFLNYVGWDVVVTNQGIKVIEGNNYSDVNILQIHKPLLINERIKDFYKYHNIIK